MLKNHFSFGEGFWDTSNRLIFWALFPSLLFTSMSRAELALLPTGGDGRCGDIRNSHGGLSDFGGSENVSHGYKGFHFGVSGKHPPQHLSRARNRRGSDGGKRIGIRSLYRSGYDHIGQFFECGDGGTIRGNE